MGQSTPCRRKAETSTSAAALPTARTGLGPPVRCSPCFRASLNARTVVLESGRRPEFPQTPQFGKLRSSSLTRTGSRRSRRDDRHAPLAAMNATSRPGAASRGLPPCLRVREAAVQFTHQNRQSALKERRSARPARCYECDFPPRSEAIDEKRSPRRCFRARMPHQLAFWG